MSGNSFRMDCDVRRDQRDWVEAVIRISDREGYKIGRSEVLRRCIDAARSKPLKELIPELELATAEDLDAVG